MMARVSVLIGIHCMSRESMLHKMSNADGEVWMTSECGVSRAHSISGENVV